MKNKILFLFLIPLLFISCQRSSEEEIIKEDSTVVHVEDMSGKIIYNENQLIVRMENFTGVFNPLNALTEGDMAVSYLCYLPLIDFENENINYDYSILKAVEVDNNSVRCRIKDDLKWNDGSFIVASDIRDSLEYIVKNPEKTNFPTTSFLFLEGVEDFINGNTDHIKGFQIIDDNSFVLNYSKFHELFLKDLIFRPVKSGFEENNKSINSSGKYIVNKSDGESYVELVPNINYKTQNLKIKQILLRNIIEEENIYKEIEDGQLHANISYGNIDGDLFNFKDLFLYNRNHKDITNFMLLGNFGDFENKSISKSVQNLVYDYLSKNGKSKEILSKSSRFYFRNDISDFKNEENIFPQSINVLVVDNFGNKNFLEDLKECFELAGITLKGKIIKEYDLLENLNIYKNSENLLIIFSLPSNYIPSSSHIFLATNIMEKLNYGNLDFKSILKHIIDEDDLEIIKENIFEFYNYLLEESIISPIGSHSQHVIKRKELLNFINSEYKSWYEHDPELIRWK